MKHIIVIFIIWMSVSSVAQTTINKLCILRSNAQFDTLCDGRVLPVFGIANSLNAPAKIPAKIIYCNEGDSVVLNTKSISQKDHHTIHLHGLDVDTRNDGDPATSFWLSHQQDTTYSFKAKHAGTYLYHCHAADVIHVQMGMYGLIVVNAAGGAKTAWTGGPAYDKDYKWLMSEVDSVWHYHVPKHDTIADTVHVPKYIPNYFLINGQCGQEIQNDDSIKVTGAQGENIYVRLANIGYLTSRIVFPGWLNARIIASDGRPLPGAISNDTCFVMPGERFGVMLQPSAQVSANILVEYLDMNTGNTVFMNSVPVTINGMVGIRQNSVSNAVKIYPNPANSILNIAGDLGPDFQIEIFDLLGNRRLSDGTKQISVTELPRGVYIIRVESETGDFRATLIKE